MSKTKDGKWTGNALVQTRVPPEMMVQLEKVARKLRIPRSEAVKKALRMLIEAHS